MIILLDTFPSLSETFLYTTILNLQKSGVKTRLLARKRGKALHQVPFQAEVSYLPSESLPFLLKFLVVLFYGLRLLFISPGAFGRAVRHLGGKSASLRQRSLAAFRILPLLCQKADLTYLPFGGLAVKYLDLIELDPNVCFSLRGSDIHIDPLADEKYKEGLIKALRKARRVHCVSAEIKQNAVELSGAQPQKFHVIFTAVNPLFLQEGALRPSTGAVRIVSVGRLDWRKGLEHGMVALRELVQRGVPCTWEIIGEGPYRVALEWAVRDMGLQKFIAFSGAKQQSEIDATLRSSDIFFHPSVHEGISNSVLEAMAAGLPVVVSDVGGMAEAVEDGVQGFLTPSRDWRAMADRLEQLAKDPALRQRMGEAGSKRVREKFSRERQIEGFKQFFQAARQNG